MPDINYKDYLKQFGEIETKAKNRIQAYLEEQIKEDAALKALYRPDKIDDCYNFIKNVVKATGCGSEATVEDAVVFKMARDFYLDILPKSGAETATEAEAETELATEEEEKPADNENSAESENEKPVIEEKEKEVMLHQADEEGEDSGASEISEAETELATKEEEKPADNENEVVTDAYGFEVFGEVPEAGAETATEAEAETELATEEEEKPADNENSAESENKEPESEPKYDEDGNGLFDFF